MSQKENWINEIINKAEEIKSASPSDELKFKLLNAIGNSGTRIYTLSPVIKWSAAAAIAILILINIYTLNKMNKYGPRESAEFAKEYFSYLNSI